MTDEPRNCSTFDEYVEAGFGGWGEGGTCKWCGRSAPRLSIGIEFEGRITESNVCEWCIVEMYGAVRAERDLALEVAKTLGRGLGKLRLFADDASLEQAVEEGRRFIVDADPLQEVARVSGERRRARDRAEMLTEPLVDAIQAARIDHYSDAAIGRAARVTQQQIRNLAGTRKENEAA